MPTPTSLFLVKAVRDLERLKSEAERQGDKRLTQLIFVLHTALVEARQLQRSPGQ